MSLRTPPSALVSQPKPLETTHVAPVAWRQGARQMARQGDSLGPPELFGLTPSGSLPSTSSRSQEVRSVSQKVCGPAEKFLRSVFFAGPRDRSACAHQMLLGNFLVADVMSCEWRLRAPNLLRSVEPIASERKLGKWQEMASQMGKRGNGLTWSLHDP